MDPPPPPQSTCQWDSRMHGGAPTGATSSPPPRWRCASRSGRCSTARWEQKKNQILGYGENGVWHMGEMGIYLRNLTAPTLLPCSPHVTTPISTTSHRTYPLRDVTSHCSPFLPICHPPPPPPPPPPPTPPHPKCARGHCSFFSDTPNSAPRVTHPAPPFL